MDLLRKRQNARTHAIAAVETDAAASRTTQSASRMLVIKDLPTNVTVEMLSTLFGECAGFETVEMKSPYAVATYTDSRSCADAKDALQSFEWYPGRKLLVDVAPLEEDTEAASTESETA